MKNNMTKSKTTEINPATKRFIVMQMPNTDYEKRYEDNEPLEGRFFSREEAEQAILAECRELVSNETELHVGRLENYLMRYAIYEMVDEMAYDLVVSFKIVERQGR